MNDPSTQLNAALIALPGRDDRLIERSRLLRRLDDAAPFRLICVRAPAGFGKTSIVTQWLRRRAAQGARIGWVSLNESHDDPRVLLRYIIAALRSTSSFVGEATLTLLNANLPMTSGSLVTTLANELRGIDEETYIVLDDFHHVAGADATGVFEALIGLTPPTLHFILTSRSALGFPVGRLRELGHLYEIPARELEFSEDELSAFLARERIDLNAAETAALGRNTGGWAAGLRLATICMRDEAVPAAFLESFSGGHTAIAEFLQEDVLNRQPAELQTFLLCTGLLDELSAAQCDFILERKDSGDLLDQIQDKGLFLFDIDGHRERYRYHRLFADFLRHRLQRNDPVRARAIYARASAWYAERSRATEAVEYALRAEDPDAAAELLESCSEAIFSSGQLELLRNLAARLPDAVVERCPRLQLDLVWIHTLCWEIADAERLIRRVRRFVGSGTEGHTLPESVREKILHREIMIALMQDKLSEAEQLWQQWPMIASGENAYFDGSAETSNLIAGRERFELQFVIAQAPRVRREFTRAGTEYGTVWFDSLVGPAYLMSGDLPKAESVLRGAVDSAARTAGPESPLVAMPSLLLADVLYERNDIDSAQTIVDDWLPRADRIGFVDQLIAGYLCAARLAALTGDRERALNVLDRGEELAAEYAFERLSAHLGGERIRQLVAVNRARDAENAVAANPAFKARTFAAPGRHASVTDCVVALARARLAPFEDNVKACVKVLKAWVNHAEGHGCVREAIRLRVVLAMMLHGDGDTRGAWRMLRPAVAMAASSGIVRPLLEEGPRLLHILEVAKYDDTRDGDVIHETVIELVRELHGAGSGERWRPRSPGVAAGPSPASSPLTARERDVLAGVADGSSNKEIAARLGLSESTVKWHLQHVFDKLGVHRRIGAVRRARELGVIG